MSAYRYRLRFGALPLRRLRVGLAVLLALALALVGGCVLDPAAPELLAVRPAHHTTTGFTNPYARPDTKNFFTYVRMRWFGDEIFADQKQEVAQIRVSPTRQPLRTSPASPRVTWLGHSTFLIEVGGRTVLTDPMLSARASPVSFAGPKRLAPLPYDLDALPPIDVVVISHNHYDHLDEATIRRLGPKSHYVVPLKLGEWLTQQGIPAAHVTELDWWQKTERAGITITATPTQHWSGRGLTDRYATLWAGWHMDFGGLTIWFAGDTGYNDVQFKEIGQRWGGVDLALIPVGGYAPRWFMQTAHVDTDDAVKIHNDIRARLSIGMHWSTFQLTAEPLDEPRQRLETLVAQGALRQGRFITLPIGGSLHLESPNPYAILGAVF